MRTTHVHRRAAYSITSPANASIAGGMISPSIFAISVLIISSNAAHDDKDVRSGKKSVTGHASTLY